MHAAGQCFVADVAVQFFLLPVEGTCNDWGVPTVLGLTLRSVPCSWTLFGLWSCVLALWAFQYLTEIFTHFQRWFVLSDFSKCILETESRRESKANYLFCCVLFCLSTCKRRTVLTSLGLQIMQSLIIFAIAVCDGEEGGAPPPAPQAT